MADQDGSNTRTAGADEAGRRLDHVVAGRAGLSRNAAVRLIARGGVALNDRATRPGDKSYAVREGDRIGVPADAGTEMPEPRPDLPLAVLGEGPGWVAVDKPAGVAVHPLDPTQRGTVLNALVARHPGVVDVGEGGLRGGVVHRLDVTTSGALLFATEQGAWEALRQAFTDHTLRKTYHALVHGVPGVEAGVTHNEERWLKITRHKPAHVSVVSPDTPGARRCSLGWRILEMLHDAALLEVDLHTGFLHQVRVMLADAGHPMLGDTAYGGDDSVATRPMLHAHAITYDDINVSCPPPEDYQEVLGQLRR